MRTKVLILMVLCLFLGFFLGVYLGSPLRPVSESKLGQSAKEAISALKRLEARVEVGISYRDYGPALGDALFGVNQFLQSPEARKNPKLAEVITKVMTHFRMAGRVWNWSISSGSSGYKYLPVGKAKFYGSRSEEEELNKLLKDILAKYPNVTEVALTGSMEYGSLSIEKVVGFIWKEASEELKQADIFLQK